MEKLLDGQKEFPRQIKIYIKNRPKNHQKNHINYQQPVKLSIKFYHFFQIVDFSSIFSAIFTGFHNKFVKFGPILPKAYFRRISTNCRTHPRKFPIKSKQIQTNPNKSKQIQTKYYFGVGLPTSINLQFTLSLYKLTSKYPNVDFCVFSLSVLI